MRARVAVAWAVRLALLAAVAWFLGQRLRWHDTLDLADGTRLTGEVRALPEGGWSVEPSDGGPARVVPGDVVASRQEEGRAVPAVSWGLRRVLLRFGARWPWGLVVLAILAGTLALTLVRWHLLLDAVALHLPLARTFRLGWIGAFFNLAVPGSTGGDVVKAWYAARTTGRPTRAVMSVFMDRVLGLFGLALLAGGALLLAPERAGGGPARAAAIALVAAGLLAGALLLLPGVRRALGLSALARRLPFPSLWAEAAEAGRLYRSHPGPLAVAVAISVANHAAAALAVRVIAGALGIEGVDLGSTIVLVPVANLLSAVPLVPGGWGVGELAFAWLFGQVGVPPTEAVAMSVVYRASVLAASLPGAPLWLVWKDRPTRASIERDLAAAGAADPEGGRA